MELHPGVPLAGRYTLLARIGRGGMSQVWRAHDGVLGRTVAVKVLATELTSDPALRAALWREARAAARLTHPQVTRIYDYGESVLAGRPPIGYLVMELVDGQNLADRLAAGPLSWTEAARIGGEVAAALSAAHEAGVIHLDIKPGNVMLTSTGAKVLDFGIAAVVGASRDHDSAMVFGTPAYAAPERLTRAAAEPAADVYSLGALLYEAITGRPPHRITTWAEAAAAHARPARPPAPEATRVPPELVDLVRSCLDPDPSHRPAARHLAARLTAIAERWTAQSPVVRTNDQSTRRSTLVERSASVSRSIAVISELRVRGGARLSRRPAPADVPAYASSEPPRISPLAVVGGAGAIVAAGLALTLLSPALSQPSAQGATTAAASDGGSAAAPRPTATSPAFELPSRAWTVLAEVDRILRNAVADGRLRVDLARKLRDEVDALRRRVADGKTHDVDRRIDKLLDEVREHLPDGAIAVR